MTGRFVAKGSGLHQSMTSRSLPLPLAGEEARGAPIIRFRQNEARLGCNLQPFVARFYDDGDGAAPNRLSPDDPGIALKAATISRLGSQYEMPSA
jgi:hypothetical protein